MCGRRFGCRTIIRCKRYWQRLRALKTVIYLLLCLFSLWSDYMKSVHHSSFIFFLFGIAFSSFFILWTRSSVYLFLFWFRLCFIELSSSFTLSTRPCSWPIPCLFWFHFLYLLYLEPQRFPWLLEKLGVDVENCVTSASTVGILVLLRGWLSFSLQWSAVTVTAVTVTVGYSDTYGNPRFITNSAYRDKKSVTVTPST